jgi:hypothetical protein
MWKKAVAACFNQTWRLYEGIGSRALEGQSQDSEPPPEYKLQF